MLFSWPPSYLATCAWVANKIYDRIIKEWQRYHQRPFPLHYTYAGDVFFISFNFNAQVPGTECVDSYVGP